MCIGVTLGAVIQQLAPVAAALIVVGFVFSRLWRWRTDPMEREAQLDNRAARDTRVLRWGEVCAGGLLLLQLAAYALDRELIAAFFALAVVVCVIATLRIDRPASR